MDVQVKIDAEAVQRELVSALINSAIGEHIKKAINEALLKKDWHSNRDLVESAVHSCMHDEIRAIVTKMLREEAIGADIRERIKSKMTTEVIDKGIDDLVNRVWKG